MHSATLKKMPEPLNNRTGWPWTQETKPLPDKMPDGKPWPKISIVTPSFNQGGFIEETIRSVLLQSYPNLEYIIIDGYSKDDSIEIIKKYEKHLTYWVSEPDRGQSHAINKGFEKAQGEIFGWLNSDDLLLPGSLGHVAAVYRENPSAVAWVGTCYWIDPNGRILNTIIPKGLKRDSIADWWYGGFFMQPSCFFSAKAWKKLNGLDESLHYAMDFDLWLKLSEIGDFVRIPRALSAAIIHDKAKSQRQIPEMNIETFFVQFKHGYRQAATHRLVNLSSGQLPDYKLITFTKFKLINFVRRLWNSGKKQQDNTQYLVDVVKDL